MFGGRPADISGSSSSSQTPLPVETDRQTDSAELLDLLATASDSVALKLLGEVRSHDDFAAALARIKQTGSTDSQYGGKQEIKPPDQRGIEFELMTRHPVLFPADAPLDGSLDPTTTCTQTIPAAGNLDQAFGPMEESHSIQLVEEPFHRTLTDDSHNAKTSSSGYRAALHDVDFSKWTTVAIDNSAAAEAMLRYLELDHPILGLFDEELFLSDLCQYRPRYCSGLLVNALLGWICLGSTIESIGHSASSADFFSEASSMWNTGQRHDSFATLPAIQLLSLTATYLGQGEKGLHFLQQSISMGKRMGLVGDDAPSLSMLPDNEGINRASSHCAWGLFAFAMLHSLHCQQGELEVIPPPKLPLPYVLSHIDNPQDVTNPPIQPTSTFRCFCQLWHSVHAIICRYYASDKPPKATRFDTKFVGTMVKRLLRLGDQLPLWLARGNQITHHGMILHIMFHAALISLLRPLVLENNPGRLGLESYSDKPAEAISNASVKQMRRLISIYQAQFHHRVPTVFWHTGCLFLANYAVRSTAPFERRVLDFYLAVSGYESLYSRYPVVIAIVKGILAMAVSEDLIGTQDAYKIVLRLRHEETEPRPVEKPTQVCFMVDLDLAVTDQEKAHIDSLAQRFDDLILFDEFTHGQVDNDGGVTIS